jgi:uncharacterized protein YdeI (YjbR/CyaY-like superfamily)
VPSRPPRKPARRATARRKAAAPRKRVVRARPVIGTPWELEQELKNDPRVRAVYAAMPASHRRAYVSFIEEAKRPETRVRRVQQALRMMTQWGEEHPARRTRKR